jgi:peptidoglycan/LPS O-acetylase OafA/YrhL
MDETWYLACDMQMFIVSPLLIWPLWRWRRAGVAWILLNIVAFTSGIIAVYIIWDLPATAFVTRPYKTSTFSLFHCATAAAKFY